MSVLKCPGDIVNNYKCIQGMLFEENIATGGHVSKGPCKKCEGTERAPVQKLQLPNQPAAPAVDSEVRRITNNIMGHIKTPTNAKQQEYVQRMRDLALEFYVLLHDAGGTDPNQDRFANRNLAMAATDMEVSLMHAVKGVCARK